MPIILKAFGANTEEFLKPAGSRTKWFVKVAGVGISTMIQFPAASRNPFISLLVVFGKSFEILLDFLNPVNKYEITLRTCPRGKFMLS